jgi:hypothetical protein
MGSVLIPYPIGFLIPELLYVERFLPIKSGMMMRSHWESQDYPVGFPLGLPEWVDRVGCPLGATLNDISARNLLRARNSLRE